MYTIIYTLILYTTTPIYFHSLYILWYYTTLYNTIRRKDATTLLIIMLHFSNKLHYYTTAQVQYHKDKSQVHGQNKTRQDRTRQDRIRQDKTRQNSSPWTRQDRQATGEEWQAPHSRREDQISCSHGGNISGSAVAPVVNPSGKNPVYWDNPIVTSSTEKLNLCLWNVTIDLWKWHWISVDKLMMAPIQFWWIDTYCITNYKYNHYSFLNKKNSFGFSTHHAGRQNCFCHKLIITRQSGGT